MNLLKLKLENCYGIQKLEHDFDFSTNGRQKSFTIYAPNGFMKTSFTRTFEQLAIGKTPKEERFGRQTSYSVEADGSDLSSEAIHVLKSEIDIASDSPAVTDILVNPAQKARYDELLVDLDKLKVKLVNSLQKKSKVKKVDIEATLLKDWDADDFASGVEAACAHDVTDNLEAFVYGTLFDPATVTVLESPDFVANASEFNSRYQELFEQAGTIYEKGVFNPTKAETSFSTLDKQGYFSGGHRVHLRGEDESIDKAALDQKLAELNASIEGDETLKELKNKLTRNAKTQALVDLLESLDPTTIENLLERIKPANQGLFKKDLWAFYLRDNSDAEAYLTHHSEAAPEIAQIEQQAAQSVEQWTEAVELFNDRFVDMPFNLSVANQADAVLGIGQARLLFTFTDNQDAVTWNRQELKTLSQGEKRALHLLNFIFEVQARRIKGQETLFIIDDAADSFDYKNKHAIVQYLADLNETEFFHQIILTHNYDFFRTLVESKLVHYAHCLMANKEPNQVILAKAVGIKNYFIGKWKNEVMGCASILCATIPFTRNLIEYTRGSDDPDYIKLTSLLHWKNDTDQITVGDYLDIYNRLFGFTHDTTDARVVKDILFNQANAISNQSTQTGLNLEDKVVLSMAIRIKTEIFMLAKLRDYKGDQNYWPAYTSQFGNMLGEYKRSNPEPETLRTLRKVELTVSSNIHLNSFMYEPILDLGLDYLSDLYRKASQL